MERDLFHTMLDCLELLEAVEDLAVLAERRDEPTVSHEQLIAELRRDGLLKIDKE